MKFKKTKILNKYFEESLIKSLFLTIYSKKLIKKLNYENVKVVVLTDFHKQFIQSLNIIKNEIEIVPNFLQTLEKPKKQNNELEQNYMDLLHPTLNERRSYVSILRNPNFSMNDYQKKYRSFIVNCECGANVMMSSLYNHKKSKKHIKFEKICIKI